MKIVRIRHGLANQMFEYIFYKFLDLYTDDVCYLDDSYFTSPDVNHNGLEIEKIFNVKPLWLKDCFSSQAWEKVAEVIRSDNLQNLHNYFDSLGIHLNIITDDIQRVYYLPEREWKYNEPKEIYNIPYLESSLYNYNIRSIDFAGHCYFAGVWASDIFFSEISDIILKDFEFPELDERNKKYAEDMSGCSSVGIHVRRTGFVGGMLALNATRYVRPISIIRNSVRKPVFFIFSDDLDWCKANLEKMSLTPHDEVVFISGNTGPQSFRDMQLMTYCKHLIRSPGSTFSYMADILNRNPYRKTLSRKFFY